MKNLFIFLLGTFSLLACSPEISQENTNSEGDWRHHGGNHNSDKYSPLDQIDGSNFSELELAWRYRSPDLDLPEDLAYPTGDYRAVPLVVDGIMYVNSNHGLISALNSATGEELWVFDPKSYELGPPLFSPLQTRGIEYWTDGEIERIFIATSGKQLVSVDIKTGQPDPNFGDDGYVDLKQNFGRLEFEMNNKSLS